MVPQLKIQRWYLGIAIRCTQHFQAMLERGVCELAHSFFHIYIEYSLKDHAWNAGVRFIKRRTTKLDQD